MSINTGKQRAQDETRGNLPMAKEDEISSDRTIPEQKRNVTQTAQNTTSGMNVIETLKSVIPNDREALKADYKNKGMDKAPDTFVLYRIIGNDLYPRHKKGQTLENLQFVLKNEPELESCEKRWIVNRIINKETEQALIELLGQYNQPFIHIPFREEEYKVIGWDIECLPEVGYLTSDILDRFPNQRKKLLAATYRLKNNYVMNNNGARNVALRDGKPRAKWILPWDGNCFVTAKAWKQILADVTASPYLKYFVVPMTRIVHNKMLLSDEFTPNPLDEPQLIFRKDSAEEFNEDFYYGRRPKVELFWRLGMPGYWNQWKDDPWDLTRPTESSESYQFGVAGWVARMYSGMKTLEHDSKQRSAARLEAIIGTLRNLDINISGRSTDSNELLTYRIDVLRQERNEYRAGKQMPPIEQLIEDANVALTRGPYSVIDKKDLPPNGEASWHPEPYWGLNPDSEERLPYIKREEVQGLGTKMYKLESDKYDRTFLQHVFEDSIALALAWFFTGKIRYAEHGARILERYFTNQDTRMPPQLNYAPVRLGQNNNKGHGFGIIEMKDMYYYLDAVRLLKSAGTVSEGTFLIFKEWLSTYLDWLVHSKHGKDELKSMNYHGTYYDLQIAAIADFLGDQSLIFEALIRVQSRITQQFASDGSQVEELLQTKTAHYCYFNLQAWIHVAEIASRWGTDLWSYQSSNGVSLKKAVQWLLSHVEKEWPYQQIDEFAAERYFPIWFTIPKDSIELPASAKIQKSKYMVKSKYPSNYGVRPYWNLGLSKP